jgi:exosortase/archaeosortase family protein
MGKRTQKKKVIKEIFIFLIKFNVLLIPFYLIILLDINFYPLQIQFANFIAIILKGLGHNVEISNFILYVDNSYPIDISRDCIGWKGIYSLFALLFATRGKIKNKLKFFAIWAPILFLINIFRVLITLLIGLNYGLAYLEIAHSFLWQEGMILIVVAVWYVWLKKGNLIGDARNIL